MSSSHDPVETSPIMTDLLPPAYQPTEHDPTLSPRSPLNTNTTITTFYPSCRPTPLTRSSTPPPPPLDSPQTSKPLKALHPRHVLTEHLTASLVWAAQITIPGLVEKMKEELLAQRKIRTAKSKDWVYVAGYDVLDIVDRWEGMMGGGFVEDGENCGERKGSCCIR
ncbi:hypothetical protein DL95DRAFT_483976 [Leptodontidium sp. 2 PMI_412]|nr:hypothetical protein DL95DRAFT_483976 [Leptodontidium sp. 2 PMI_412]